MWRIWRYKNELAQESGSQSVAGIFPWVLAGPLWAQASQPATGDHLTVAGVIEDAQGKAVKEVKIELLVNGKHLNPLEDERVDIGSKGGFVGRYRRCPRATPTLSCSRCSPSS